MAEVGGVGPDQGRVGEGGPSPVDRTGAQSSASGQPVGQPGPLGQPTGLPVPELPGRAPVMPDVLVGRDASQLAAAEQMRARGGASAMEELLGLNRQPTMVGALPPPPGNSEALRHMTPTMRRTVMRNLLDKQRARLRDLARLLRRERDGGGGGSPARDDDADGFADETPLALAPSDEAQAARARAELGDAVQMLQLLDELLAMQDYAVSQMGTFTQG